MHVPDYIGWIDNEVIRVRKHNVSKVASSASVKVFVPSVKVSNVDDVCDHLDLILYNIIEFKRFFEGNLLVVDKLDAVRNSIEEAVVYVESMDV